ncbi:hypothetical protein HDV62DRAFT_368297 [Trichoderma sp. SZMC 28011]
MHTTTVRHNWCCSVFYSRSWAASIQSTRRSQSRPNSQATRTTRGRSQRSATASSTTMLAALETQPEIKSKSEEDIDSISTTYQTRC